MGRVEPLSSAETLLLDGFVAVLNEEPQAKENFDDTCDLLEGLTKAAKASVRLTERRKNERGK